MNDKSSSNYIFRTKKHIITAMILLAIMASGAVFTWQTVVSVDSHMRNDLLKETNLVAQAIRADEIESLSGIETETDLPQYIHLKEQLSAIRSANTKCRFIYLMGRRTDGAIFFFVDSEPEGSKDYSPPGQIYNEIPEFQRQIFETRIATVGGPNSDRWGTWVSGSVPVINPKTGIMLAVLGMDIDANTWKYDVAATSALPIGLALILLIGMSAALISARSAHATPKPVLRRLLLPLAAMVILLITGTAVLLWQQHLHQLEDTLTKTTSDIPDELRSDIKQQTLGLSTALYPIAADKDVQRTLRSGDTNQLLSRWQPIFETLHRNDNITHFSFLDKDRRCILRLHKPETSGDIIDRFTTLEAERTGKTASGIELSPLGTLTMRVVQPIFDDIGLVGYAELGKEIADVLQGLRTNSDNHLAILINKDNLDRKSWEDGMRALGRDANWDRLSRYAIIYASQGELPNQFLKWLENSLGNNDSYDEQNEGIPFNGRSWRLSSAPLSDASGKEIGDILIMQDISSANTQFTNNLSLGGTITAVLLTLLLSFIYLILRRTDTGILAQQNAIMENEIKYRKLIDMTDTGYLIMDSHGKVLDANQEYVRISGHTTLRDIIGRNIIEWISEGVKKQNVEAMAQCTRDGFIRDFITEYIDASGRITPVEINASFDREGESLRIVSLCRDITKRKLAEEKLRVSETRTRIITDSAQDAILMMDANGAISFWNPAAELMFGYKHEEAIGQNLHRLLAPDRYHEAHHAIFPFFKKTGMGGAVGKTLDLEAKRKDGKEINIQLSLSAIQIDGAWNAVGLLRDVTIQKQTDTLREIGSMMLQILNEPTSLKDSIQKILRLLKDRTGFDAIGIRLQDGEDFPYFVYDGFPKDFIVEENSLTVRDLAGNLCRDCDGKVSLECACGLVISGKTDPTIPIFTSGGSFWTNESFPLLELHSDKDPRLHPRNNCIHKGYASIALIPIRMKDEIIGLLQFNDRRKGCFSLSAIEQLESMAAHLGEAFIRKRAEDELASINLNLEKIVDQRTSEINRLLKQKNAFINQLSHDLKTPLVPLVGLLPLIAKRLTDPDDCEMMAAVTRSVTFMQGLVEKTLWLAKLNSDHYDLELEHLEIAPILEECIKNIDTQLGDRTVICSFREIEGVRVKGNPLALQQVFHNLLSNAVQYTGTQGKIKIDSAVEENDIRIVITDSGIGMAKVQVDHAFDEFYRADASRNSSSVGLGLSIVKRIIDKHGGRVWIESQGVGEGTSIFLTFPKIKG